MASLTFKVYPDQYLGKRSWYVGDQEGRFCAGNFSSKKEAQRRCDHMQRREDWANASTKAA